MSAKGCPVNQTIIDLKESIESNRLKDPRCRRIAEDILELLDDFAWGRAGDDHIPAVKSLSEELIVQGPDPDCVKTGEMIRSALSDHLEVFTSHAQTHNCPNGDCVKLAPAPCQAVALTLLGDQGTMDVSIPDGRIVTTAGPEEEVFTVPDPGHPSKPYPGSYEQIRAFVDGVRYAKPLSPGPETWTQVMAVGHAAARSAETGEAVAIPPATPS